MEPNKMSKKSLENVEKIWGGAGLTWNRSAE